MIIIQIKFFGTKKNCQVSPNWNLKDLKGNIESLFPQLKEQIKYEAKLKSKCQILFNSDSIERIGNQEIQCYNITNNDTIVITVISSPQTKEQFPRVSSQNFNTQYKVFQRPYKITQRLFECEKCKKLESQIIEYQENNQFLQQQIQQYIHQLQTQERKIEMLTNLNKKSNQINYQEFSSTVDDFKLTKQRYNTQLLKKNESLQAELTTIKIEQKEKALEDLAIEYNNQIEMKNQEILFMKQHLDNNQTLLEDRKKLYDQQEIIFQDRISSKDQHINIITKDLEKKTQDLQYYKNILITQLQNG